MTMAEYVKSIGLSSVKEMATISTVGRGTLDNWWNDSPQQFKCMARGCVSIKNGTVVDGIIDIKECVTEIKNLLHKSAVPL